MFHELTGILVEFLLAARAAEVVIVAHMCRLVFCFLFVYIHSANYIFCHIHSLCFFKGIVSDSGRSTFQTSIVNIFSNAFIRLAADAWDFRKRFDFKNAPKGSWVCNGGAEVPVLRVSRNMGDVGLSNKRALFRVRSCTCHSDEEFPQEYRSLGTSDNSIPEPDLKFASSKGLSMTLPGNKLHSKI